MREHLSSKGKLAGPTYTNSVGVGEPETYWQTSYLDLPKSVFDKTIVVGVGVRGDGEDMSALRVWTRTLQSSQ